MGKTEALNMARQFKKAMEAAGIPFSSVVVFGSAARDEMRTNSDIDIAVVGTPFKTDRMQEMHEIWRLRRPISLKIQPIWFYPEHLEDKYSTLAQEIKKEGIEV